MEGSVDHACDSEHVLASLGLSLDMWWLLLL
jgi:hypothetical protein